MNTMFPKIPPFRNKGHRMSASKDWNPVIRTLRTLAGVGDHEHDIQKDFPCTIVDTGPFSEADYSDERYWVRRIWINSTDADWTEIISDHIDFMGLASDNNYWFTATNLPEINTSTHLIDTDSSAFVHVFRILDKSDPPTFHYYFWQDAVGESCWATINGSDANGYEWYEVEALSDGGWEQKQGGRTEDTDGLAYPFTSDRVFVGTTEGTTVLLVKAHYDGGVEWRFDPPLPHCDTAYQVLACESDTLLWKPDWVRAH